MQATKSKLVKVRLNLRDTPAYCTDVQASYVAFALLLAVPLAFAIAQEQTADSAEHDGIKEFWGKVDTLITHQQYADAEQIMDQHLAIGHDPAAAYFQIGKIYFRHEAWHRSATFLEKSLKLNATNDEAHQLLGLDWRELHRPADAETELTEAAKENPANRVNTYLAGHQLLLNGKFEAALPYLYNALGWRPIQSQVLQALAIAQARLGNYGSAELYCRKVIDSKGASDEDRYPALVNLSTLLLLGHDTAQLEEGLTFAQRAKKLQPDSAAAHFLAGKALFKLGRLKEATTELTRAAQLDPADTKPHFLLARIYDQLGQHDRAQEERENIAKNQTRSGQAGMATGDAVPITLENLPERRPR